MARAWCFGISMPLTSDDARLRVIAPGGPWASGDLPAHTEEMAAGENRGRGPDGNSDDGLPEIDVEIPDDIRELDREVQAYRRELRQRRRHALLQRLVPGFRRLGPYGVLAPVIAIALIATAAFGGVLTLLGPKTTVAPPETSASSSDDAGSADNARVGRPLPNADVTVDGTAGRLSGIRSAVVVSVPKDCRCKPSIDTLVSTARTTGVAVYFSGDHAETTSLAQQAGRYPHVLDDATTVLRETYHPAGLSAVLVDAKGTVDDVVQHVDDGKPLSEKQLERLDADA